MHPTFTAEVQVLWTSWEDSVVCVLLWEDCHSAVFLSLLKMRNYIIATIMSLRGLFMNVTSFKSLERGFSLGEHTLFDFLRVSLHSVG